MAGMMARMLWVAFPLMAVALASAQEWPARAQMEGNDTVREAVVPVANAWAGWVARLDPAPPATPSVQPTLAVKRPAAPEAVAKAPLPVASVASTPVVRAAVLSEGTVLLLGDSLMGEVARGVRKGLPQGIKVVDKHRSSTGLANQGYYDWPSEAAAFARDTQPRWVVIHLGANDGQGMVANGRAHAFGSPSWKENYLLRAQALIDGVHAAAPGATIVWLGMPAMRSGAFEQKMAIITSLHQQAAQSRGVAFYAGKSALGEAYSKDGAGRDGKRHIWRADDGVHYSREGGWRLAEEVGVQASMQWAWMQ